MRFHFLSVAAVTLQIVDARLNICVRYFTKFVTLLFYFVSSLILCATPAMTLPHDVPPQENQACHPVPAFRASLAGVSILCCSIFVFYLSQPCMIMQ